MLRALLREAHCPRIERIGVIIHEQGCLHGISPKASTT
jgi:hypothetical protein